MTACLTLYAYAGLLGWLRGDPALPPPPPPQATAPPQPTLAPTQLLSMAALTLEPAAEGPSIGPAVGQGDPQGAALLAAKMGRYAAEFELHRQTLACARGALHSVDGVSAGEDA